MHEIPERVGPYRVLSKVGEGGMGVVYKAEDQRLKRVVALKVIREFDSAPSRRRFWQEARAAAQVAHPNACRIYDVAEEQDRLVLVMEFIDGESLTRRIERGPLPAQEAAQIVLATLSALEAFHKIGIVHRDLKPSNIMLSGSGTKLLDFGIAKHVALNFPEETAATLPDATNPGIFLGTPRYASPEQFRCQAVDARSDLFSLGAIFFEMLTGQPPFTGESFGEIADSVLHGSPPELSGSPAISVIGRIVHRARARSAATHCPAISHAAAERGDAVFGVQPARGDNGFPCWSEKPGCTLLHRGLPIFGGCTRLAKNRQGSGSRRGVDGSAAQCGLSTADYNAARRGAERNVNLVALLASDDAGTPRTPR